MSFTAATVPGQPAAPPSRRAPAVRRLLEATSADSARAGRLLLLLAVVPAVAVTAWLLVAVPLAATGHFRPGIVVPAAVVLAIPLVRWATRLPRRSGAGSFTAPWSAVVATSAIAVGFAGFAAVRSSQQAVLHRDAGTYAQVGLWLSDHPGLTTPVPVDAFGAAAAQLTFAHPGFYVQDGLIVPQFMTGWPTMLAAAHWVAGWQGMFVLPALVGGAALLAVGGLAGRLFGARWAPVAALLLGSAWPMLRVSQTTYSEPLACLMLAAGLCLAAGAWNAGVSADGPARSAETRRDVGWSMALSGLLLSAGELVRLDMGVDFALMIPAIGWWWLRRRGGVWPFAAGAVVGGGLGFLDCRFVTWPYVLVNWSSVRLMIVVLVLSPVVTAGLALFLRRWHRDVRTLRWWRWAPPVAAAGTLVLGLLLAVRPLLYVDRSITAANTIEYVASHQEQFGLPVDGTRSYAEQTVSWVSWYTGWPVLVLAWIGAAGVVYAVTRGRGWRFLPILLVYGGSGVASLLRPAITPDHPWADRRLVVEVLPAVALFATWTLAALIRSGGTGRVRAAATGGWRAAGRLLAPTPTGALARLVVLLAIAAPALVVTARLGPNRTEVGEPDAAAAVCRALRPTDSVVMMDTQWSPTIRNQCGLPVAALENPTVERMQEVVAGIRAAGQVPVLMSSSTLTLLPYGLPLERIVYLDTHEDQHVLTWRPTGTDPRRLECWLVRP
ncbi:hypothetical protein AB0J72_18945 [Dactylosporangium sp. NPDC049742]|uniref:hypothetical protein n=1 Tax=Dactylosporangium sp. NPDC049742 TaxID=3154737 RepID=UPI00342DA125